MHILYTVGLFLSTHTISFFHGFYLPIYPCACWTILRIAMKTENVKSWLSTHGWKVGQRHSVRLSTQRSLVLHTVAGYNISPISFKNYISYFGQSCGQNLMYKICLLDTVIPHTVQPEELNWEAKINTFYCIPFLLEIVLFSFVFFSMIVNSKYYKVI